VKGFSDHLRDKRCKCPDGWSVLASFDNWCVCIDNEPVGVTFDDDSSKGRTELHEHPESQLIRAGSDQRPIQFPLLESDDTVRVRVTPHGMSIKIGTSRFFAVPEDEQPHVWRVIEDRLHG